MPYVLEFGSRSLICERLAGVSVEGGGVEMQLSKSGFSSRTVGIPGIDRTRFDRCCSVGKRVNRRFWGEEPKNGLTAIFTMRNSGRECGRRKSNRRGKQASLSIVVSGRSLGTVQLMALLGIPLYGEPWPTAPEALACLKTWK
jgi:hypothetical protein